MAREDSGSALRVVVVDQPLFARSLELALPAASGDRINVVATAETVDEAIKAFDEHEPDVALIDLDLPNGGAFRLFEKALADKGPLKVIAVVEAAKRDEAVDALALGVHAAVSRDTKPEHLLAPVLAVVQGWRVLPDGVLDDLVVRAQRPGSEVLDDLSDETIQLWMLVAEGLDLSAIAQRIHVSERTAKRMVAELRERVGAESRTQLATMAGRIGLVDDGWLDSSASSSTPAAS